MKIFQSVDSSADLFSIFSFWLSFLGSVPLKNGDVRKRKLQDTIVRYDMRVQVTTNVSASVLQLIHPAARTDVLWLEW